jgi:hypothetical protein
MDTTKADLVFLTTQFDRANAILRIRLAIPDVSDQPGKKGIRIVRVQTEDDEFWMLARIHQPNGVEERWVRIIHVCSVPAMLADDVSNFLVHHPSEANVTDHRAAVNRLDLIKPRGPRLRVQRFVMRHLR